MPEVIEIQPSIITDHNPLEFFYFFFSLLFSDSFVVMIISEINRVFGMKFELKKKKKKKKRVDLVRRPPYFIE